MEYISSDLLWICNQHISKKINKWGINTQCIKEVHVSGFIPVDSLGELF